MNRYAFNIVAKRRNAIGVYERFEPTVDAETLKQAELALYDHYDHIRIVSVNADGQNIQYMP